jgi:hypothetical protein
MILRAKSFLKLLLLLFVTTLYVGCEQSNEVAPDYLKRMDTDESAIGQTAVYYGPATQVGKGIARTWVETTSKGTPVAIGIDFTAKTSTIESLPNEQKMYHLEFPTQVNIAPYKGMMFDWNPNGHIPNEMYSKPHFDFHFYMISDMERMAIPLEIGHKHSNQFARKYMPANYMSLELSIPGMGNHWMDKAAPELIGEGFSKTLILGAYQDKQIFIEPMITLEYLQGLKPHQSVTDPVSQFPNVQASGFYPKTYTMTYDPTRGMYKIALTNLYYREAK